MELTDRKYNPFFYKENFDTLGDDHGATLFDYFAAHAPVPPEAFKVDFDKRPEIMDQAHHGERGVVEFLLMQEGQWHFKYPRLREYISDSGHFDWKKLEDSKPRKGSKRKGQATAFLDEVIKHMEDDLKWVTAYAIKKTVVWRWTYAKLMLAERWREVGGTKEPVVEEKENVSRETKIKES